MLHNKWAFEGDPSTPVWRIYLIDLVARALGVLVYANGMPIGSNRLSNRHPMLCERQD